MTEPVPRVITGETAGQIDATLVPRYGGEATFARLPRIDEVTHADAAVLGVPFDGGVSYRPGARFGPAHIRESSRLLRPCNPALQASPFALYTGSDLTQDSELGFQVISAPDVEELGVPGTVQRIRQRAGDRPVYVSVDIDVLDPAHAPGTGIPEAGGLSSRELLAALRSFARLNLVGADIVEVAPAYDHAQITGIAAAHVGYELLSSLAARG
jgi:arginase family enzyme